MSNRCSQSRRRLKKTKNFQFSHFEHYINTQIYFSTFKQYLTLKFVLTSIL